MPDSLQKRCRMVKTCDFCNLLQLQVPSKTRPGLACWRCNICSPQIMDFEHIVAHVTLLKKSYFCWQKIIVWWLSSTLILTKNPSWGLVETLKKNPIFWAEIIFFTQPTHFHQHVPHLSQMRLWTPRPAGDSLATRTSRSWDPWGFRLRMATWRLEVSINH